MMYYNTKGSPKRVYTRRRVTRKADGKLTLLVNLGASRREKPTLLAVNSRHMSQLAAHPQPPQNSANLRNTFGSFCKGTCQSPRISAIVRNLLLTRNLDLRFRRPPSVRAIQIVRNRVPEP